MDNQMPGNDLPPQTPPTSGGKNVGMAIVAYILFFIPLLTDAKNDPFVKYHVKQGLVLFIAGIIVTVFSMIPVIGWFLGPVLMVALIVLFVVGIINAVGGKEEPLPVIGKFGDEFKF